MDRHRSTPPATTSSRCRQSPTTNGSVPRRTSRRQPPRVRGSSTSSTVAPRRRCSRARSSESVADQPLTVGKVEVDFLGPIPQGRCAISVDVLRPGRQVRQVQALMSFPDVGDRPVVAARAWLFSAEASAHRRRRGGPGASPLPGSAAAAVLRRSRPGWGYGPSIEWRFVAAASTRPAVPRCGRAYGCRWSLMSRRRTSSGCSWSPTRRTGSAPHCRCDEWLSIPPALTVVVLPPAGRRVVHARRADGDRVAGHRRRGSIDRDEHGTVRSVLQPLLIAPIPPRGLTRAEGWIGHDRDSIALDL